ncbi:MAG TPA: hypothetical protein VN177_15060 [Myxococcales bacterium]|nr:hypothetical protein [Myxococcales bacterium]
MLVTALPILRPDVRSVIGWLLIGFAVGLAVAGRWPRAVGQRARPAASRARLPIVAPVISLACGVLMLVASMLVTLPQPGPSQGPGVIPPAPAPPSTSVSRSLLIAEGVVLEIAKVERRPQGATVILNVVNRTGSTVLWTVRPPDITVTDDQRMNYQSYVSTVDDGQVQLGGAYVTYVSPGNGNRTFIEVLVAFSPNATMLIVHDANALGKDVTVGLPIT